MGLVGASNEEIIKAIIGGLLISLSSSLNVLFKGQITGMSGTLFGVIKKDESFHWKSCLFFGMTLTSAIFYLVQDEGTYFETLTQFQTGLSTFGFVFAGYFTGLGAKLQNGCTSGHGVCGLPRLSLRSFVAVMVFMCSAFATANIKYYGFPDYKSHINQLFNEDKDTANQIETSVILGISALIVAISMIVYRSKISDCLVGLVVGVIFALGLIISGMVKRSIVIGFLTFNDDWNPALAFVLGCACIPNLLTFHIAKTRQSEGKQPLLAPKYCIPNNKTIDLKLISGGICFGVGWGLGGMCPGPIFCNLSTFFVENLFFCFPALVLGLFTPPFVEFLLEQRQKAKQQEQAQQQFSARGKLPSETSSQAKVHPGNQKQIPLDGADNLAQSPVTH